MNTDLEKANIANLAMMAMRRCWLDHRIHTVMCKTIEDDPRPVAFSQVF